ncbi:sigma factor-like helix-turn-helix DNA-binding protein [Pseudomonas japonica]|uniref:sigma factor-like helix-turn-helix DNA-binding protein n=1 Tax=Pseudomonas japonica TaxID=256466 RepID=UPI0038012164
MPRIWERFRGVGVLAVPTAIWGWWSRVPDNSPLNAYVQRRPERERQIIVGHYFQQLSFWYLPEPLDVGKSRVSQLYGQALKRIRQGGLRRW